MSRSGWIAVAAVFVATVALVVVGVLYRRPIVVPDVRLMSTNEAATLLRANKLKLGSQGQAATDAVGAGLIAQQSPAPDATEESDAAVDVTIAVAPTLARIPDLHGQDVEEAMRILSDAYFDAQVVDIFSAEREPGVVVQQSPAAGSEWITGRPVAIAVVVGPDDGTAVKVPKVKGMLASEAYAALKEAGLSGAGFLAHPGEVERSVVVKQLPGKGILLRPGTTVFLLLDVPK